MEQDTEKCDSRKQKNLDRLGERGEPVAEEIKPCEFHKWLLATSLPGPGIAGEDLEVPGH